MYRIALNVAISFYRKEKKAAPVVFLSESNAAMEQSNDSVNEIDENFLLLQQFINQLLELDRALILLYLDSKSHNEIAEILGISETNVGTKISRIKEKLKQKFLNNK